MTPANPSIAPGTTEQFTATGTYSDSTTENLTTQVTWASATHVGRHDQQYGPGHVVSRRASTITATLGRVTGTTL